MEGGDKKDLGGPPQAHSGQVPCPMRRVVEGLGREDRQEWAEEAAKNEEEEGEEEERKRVRRKGEDGEEGEVGEEDGADY